MNFDDLDAKMRRYETQNERSFFQETDLVVRLDGRGFSGLTDRLKLEKPFDTRFNGVMTAVTEFLMNDTHFKIAYGYHQSDEISLLLSRKDDTFGRKERKMLSLLASAASAKFTHDMGVIATFDARVSVLPSTDLVIDYFRWRQEDALRNALSGYAFWTLRKSGLNGRQAARALEGATRARKNEILFEHGINFNNVTPWHKRGIGLWKKTVTTTGFNRYFKQAVEVTRRRLVTQADLPYGDDYAALIYDRLTLEDNITEAA